MKYQVLIMPEAEANIAEAFAYIAQDASERAAKWVQGLYTRIDTLENLPGRCVKAREAAYSHADMRQLIYKSHRIIFTIDNSAREVKVIYVRHSRMRTIGE